MKHLLRDSSLLVCLLLLSGCQLLETLKKTVTVPAPVPVSANPTNSLSAAKQLEANGRYGEAVALLEQAIAAGGKTELYTTPLKEIRQKQRLVEQELADQLLISETTALKNQIPILEKLTRSNPNEWNYAQQLKEMQSHLLQFSQDLSECGLRHFEQNTALAKACLTLALSLNTNERDQRLMHKLLAEQDEDREKTESERRIQRKTAWKQRNESRLKMARQYNESGQLTEARRVLKVVLKDDPKNKKAKDLLTDVESRLLSYLENLLAAGDRLYREGEIEGAKATWRAALTLDPQNQHVLEKIERAQRVLDNLTNLRQSDAKKP